MSKLKPKYFKFVLKNLGKLIIPQVRHDNKHRDRHAQKWGILSFISIQNQFNLHDQIFLIFFKTKLLVINLSIVEHFMLHLTIYVKNLKKNNERYRTIQSILSHDACTSNISM